MKEKRYASNTVLAIVLGIFFVACTVSRAFVPMVVLPRLTIPNMVLLSLAALLIAHYAAPGKSRCDGFALLLAALTFGLLPYAAGFATGTEALKLALIGGIAFFAAAWLFGEAMERLSSGPAAKAAPVITAFCLYLAAQCFAGILL